jgi:hypothetical protein
MMYMQDGIQMDTVFGDGSAGSGGGLFGKLLGAGKRLITGESLFTTVYTNEGHGKRKVAFAAPYTGKIIPFDLSQHGGTLICQRDAFLCAAKGVSLGIAFQKQDRRRPVRRRRLHHAEARRRRHGLHPRRRHPDGKDPRPARNPARGHRLRGGLPRPASISTSSTPARSKRPCSAVKACSSPPSAARARCGCSPCPCRAWPTAS